MKLHIGIDDTDSKTGMCTTYIAALVNDRLTRFSKIMEIKLIRLNPNIPWKTRGNGAVALVIDTDHPEWAVEEVLDTVRTHSSMGAEGTNPGVVFLEGEVNSVLRSFYYRALHELVSIEDAESVARECSCTIYKYKNGRGIIGGLAAIGADLKRHTFEIITYRRPENWGKPRKIDVKSVLEMDETTSPPTFNNVDRETSRILITPRSPCPVLFGIRSFEKNILKTAKDMVKTREPIERMAVFKTNQGTDAHLIERSINEVKPFSSVITCGVVVKSPMVVKGGHVIITLENNNARIDGAAYEPTGGFRDIVKKLNKGDIVKAYGGVSNARGLTINLEKLEILKLGKALGEINPACKSCGRRMESSGKDQGYRCRRCRTKAEHKEVVTLKRAIKPGLYGVPTRAMRHISMPVDFVGKI